MKPKTIKVIMWILIALMTVQFVAAGIGKLTGAWESKFIEWGYSILFMYFIGVLEIASVIILYISKLRKWAIIGLVIIMFGAAITHILHQEYFRIIHNVILITILSLIFYLDKRVT